ncbi:MAG: nucleotidyltransferase family protein [Bacteroidetes bacterium]|nr:nucleotidyltransferase family protein [Bacteroidota bacterium]
MKAVILAAGIGSRLSPYTNIIPKALMPISLDESGKFRSILEQLIYQISLAGITEIIIVVNYKAELIKSYLGDGDRFGIKLTYVEQEVLDGNGGAYYRAQKFIKPGESVFITDCDNFLSDDTCIKQFTEFHAGQSNDISVGTFPVEDITRYAIIRVDDNHKPIDIFEKPTDREKWGNTAKSGMLILGPELAQSSREISRTTENEFTTTMIIAHAIREDKQTGLFPIECEFTDIGTWKDYIRIFKGQLTH